jgi:hypothetical protein
MACSVRLSAELTRRSGNHGTIPSSQRRGDFMAGSSPRCRLSTVRRVNQLCGNADLQAWRCTKRGSRTCLGLVRSSPTGSHGSPATAPPVRQQRPSPYPCVRNWSVRCMWLALEEGASCILGQGGIGMASEKGGIQRATVDRGTITPHPRRVGFPARAVARTSPVHDAPLPKTVVVM